MKEITESNRLIAEFMGVPKCGRCEDCGAYQYSPAVIYQPEDMKYHTSWDWLIPVLVKINKYEHKDWNRDIMCNGTTLTLISLDIETVYLAVVQFIQWYNQQQTDK